LKVGLLEGFLHRVGFEVGVFAFLLIFTALSILSRGNLYLVIPSSVGIPILVISLMGVHVYRKTGRWFFRQVPKSSRHGPLEPPKYNIPLTDFFEHVETDQR